MLSKNVFGYNTPKQKIERTLFLADKYNSERQYSGDSCYINGKIEENEADVVKEYKHKTEYQPAWLGRSTAEMFVDARDRKKWKVMIACPSATDTTTEEEYTSM